MVDIPDNTTTTAIFQGDVQVVASCSGTFETAGDSDWIRLDLVAGTTYRFFARDALAGGASGDAYLRLFDAAGVELAHDDNSGSGQNAFISFTATTSGTYFVGVNDVGNAIAQYTIDVVSSNYQGSVIINGETIDTGSGGERFTSGSPGDDVIMYRDFEFFEAVENTIFGGAGDDRIVTGTNLIDPKGEERDGTSTVYGGAGADHISGGSNVDVLHGDDGDDSIAGGSGDDTLWGGAGNDILYGEFGKDTLDGGDGNDMLDGGVGSDTLNGGAGDDVLSNGGYGTDTINGGSGDDIVRLRGTALKGTIDGGTGVDTLDLRLVLLGAAVDLTAGTWGANPASGGPYAIAGIENVIGTRYADIIVGSAAANVIDGHGGDDTIQGGAGADKMIGGDGDDTYYVDNARDVVDETGTTGLDKVYASVSFSLSDPYHCKGKVETLVLANVHDIDGTGNALANRIFGNAGANTLKGLAGNDSLDGRGGNDVLVGGAGADRLTGGLGADRFVFTAPSESSAAAFGRDIIQDFNAAEGDRIDLKEIDANSVASGNQAFKFLGSAAFTHHAGELRYQAVNGNAYVYGDVNGDGKADFSIQVNHPASLQASDFIL